VACYSQLTKQNAIPLVHQADSCAGRVIAALAAEEKSPRDYPLGSEATHTVDPGLAC
jgi:hypothetical protein